MKKIIWSIVFFIFVVGASAQSLVLKRGKKSFMPVFQKGDEITIKLKGERRFVTDRITGIYQDGIRFRGTKVETSEIERIKVEFSHGFFSPSNGRKMIIAGLGFFMLDQFNHSIVQGNEARISDRVTITAAALVGVGTILSSLRFRNIKLGGKNRLYIIDPHYEGKLLDK